MVPMGVRAIGRTVQLVSCSAWRKRMFRQIVVGVDEQQGGQSAIALAKTLLARGGELTFAYVYAGDVFFYRAASAGVVDSERQRAFDMLKKTCEETGVDAHLRWRGAPSVGQGLHELCEVFEADLLVVGSSRRGLLGRVLIGDDTRAALNGAPCAIAIAPAGYSREPAVMREIGVGYNGSPESEHALELARLLAADTGAKLSAFEAIVLPAGFFTTARMVLNGAVDAVVAEARERILALGGVEAHAAYGHPAEELALYSASLNLLVVGSRGYGPIGRAVPWQHLARAGAPCPLSAAGAATLGSDDRGR